MIKASRFYRAVRQFAATRQPWQDAIRYDSLPDEEWDLTLVSERVYGNRNEALAVMAAAGLDRFDQQLTQRPITLPTPIQLEALKRQTGYATAIQQTAR